MKILTYNPMQRHWLGSLPFFCSGVGTQVQMFVPNNHTVSAPQVKDQSPDHILRNCAPKLMLKDIF